MRRFAIPLSVLAACFFVRGLDFFVAMPDAVLGLAHFASAGAALGLIVAGRREPG